MGQLRPANSRAKEPSSCAKTGHNAQTNSTFASAFFDLYICTDVCTQTDRIGFIHKLHTG
jgi:hypothetical protein